MLIASFQDYSLLRQGTEEQRSKVPGSMTNILYNLDVYHIVAGFFESISDHSSHENQESPLEHDENKVWDPVLMQISKP